MKSLSVALSFGLSLVGLTSGHVIQLHGSGTTNPSKCYWHIMDSIMDRLKVPSRMTYRAVGSSTGIKEFMGKEEDGFKQLNHFGSGDIPLDAAKYASITEKEEMLHLPIVLGAISLFHSIPGVPSGSSGLNMTSCLLARVMKREITDWMHEDIVAENPMLSTYVGKDSFDIKVARRVLGSSSTKSVTAYLHAGCPEHWGEDMVGKVLDNWPEDTMPCEGSGGMTDCIRNNAGAIGYIDAGHGRSQNLVEIELQNANGYFISSEQADAKDGIGYAAEASEGLPDDAKDDFSKVDLLNQKGDNTWPIVAMSYIYVRKDWTAYGDDFGPDQQALLMAFLESLYDPSYIDDCKDLFGFTPAYTNPKLKSIAENGLAEIIMSPEAKKFVFESKTTAYDGQADNVISVKRRSNAEYQRSQFDTRFDGFDAQLKSLELSQKAVLSNQKSEEESDNNNLIMASFIMSCVSIGLWVLFAMKFVFGGSTQSTSQYSSGAGKTEQPQNMVDA